MSPLIGPQQIATALRAAGLDDDAARAARERIMRAYLSVWSDVVSSTALSAAVDDALLIARVGRVFTWQRALTRASADERHAWGVHGRRLIAEINRSLGHAPEPSHD